MDHQQFHAYGAALEGAGLTSRPLGMVDLAAFQANAESMRLRAAGKPIRVASKSLRIRRSVENAIQLDGYQGVLAYTLPEALWLHQQGVSDDIVVGYPTTNGPALRELANDDAARSAITLMVDSADQLDLIDAAAPGHQELRLCVELDAAYQPVRGVRAGALRSPVRTADDAARLATTIARRPGFSLVGMMAYEGQIAGVGNAGSSPRALAVRLMQKLSATEIATRRGEAVDAVRAVADLEFVNGGGTGSLESTSADPSVTEMAAGSGLMGPGLFDHYTAFSPRPAQFFVLDVVRRPNPRTVTVLGGGWIASGPPDQSRLPTVAWPQGLSYAATEAAGEVQTPLSGVAANTMSLGDPVFFRHAKGGEMAEHLNEYAVIDSGEVVDLWPTYRGEGKAFL